MHPEVENWYCSFVSFISVSCMFTMTASLPLLAINRYVSMYKAQLYQKLYTRLKFTLLYFCMVVCCMSIRDQMDLQKRALRVIAVRMIYRS